MLPVGFNHLYICYTMHILLFEIFCLLISLVVYIYMQTMVTHLLFRINMLFGFETICDSIKMAADSFGNEIFGCNNVIILVKI